MNIKVTPAKDFLSQAYRIDQRINSKLEQVQSLRDLALKANATLSDIPGSTSRRTDRMESTITKMVDLENEINADIDTLVELKSTMVTVIKKVSDTEQQTLLELRYLCFKSWEQIAVGMGYGIDNVYRLRRRALASVTELITLQ